MEKVKLTKEQRLEYIKAFAAYITPEHYTGMDNIVTELADMAEPLKKLILSQNDKKIYKTYIKIQEKILLCENNNAFIPEKAKLADEILYNYLIDSSYKDKIMKIELTDEDMLDIILEAAQEEYDD